MFCSELMKSRVVYVLLEDTVQAAARRMRDANIGFVPVCDSSERALGTLTDRDIAIRLVAEGLPVSTRVVDVMTHEVVACRPDEDIQQAQDRMVRAQKSRIICADADGRLVGVISLSDIAQVESDRHASQTMRGVTSREAA
jgi:CBS domain-containing protein